MPSKGLGMLSSGEVANFRGDVGACSPREILKLRRLELPVSVWTLSTIEPMIIFYHVYV